MNPDSCRAAVMLSQHAADMATLVLVLGLFAMVLLILIWRMTK